MKNIIKSFMLLSIILALCSCSKGPEQNAQCGVMPVDKVLNIKIGAIDKTFNLWKNDGRNNDNDRCFVDVKSTVSAAEIIAGLEALHLNDAVKANPSSLISVVYFVNKNLSTKSNYSLSNDDILALFVYYESEAKLYVKVFEKINTTYQEITSLASETDWVSSNNIESYSRIFFDKGIPSVSSILMSDISKVFERKSKDHFSYKLNKYIHKGKPAKPTLGEVNLHDHGSDRCGDPCLKGGSLNCDQRPMWSCKGLTDCPKAALKPWNSYAEGEDPRDPVLYQFRDNFMDQSNTGKHFINDFYYIGSVINENLNASIAAESFTIIDTKVIPIINKLINHPESNEVLYDDATKAALIGYVNNVRVLSDDPMFLEIIDEVAINIEYFSGKTVKNVRNALLSD
jgi:hypothetical protein